MTTANDILATRTRLGWTQQRLADELGVNLRTLGRWERGERTPPVFLRGALERLEQRIDGPSRLGRPRKKRSQ